MIRPGTLLRLGTSKYGVIVLVLFLIAQGYLLIQLHPTALDPVRADAADRLADEVVAAIGDHVQSGWSSRYVKVARLAGDPGDQIRRRIEKALPARTNCKLVKDSVLAQLRDEATARAGRLGVVDRAKADAWQGEAADSFEDALGIGRDKKLDYVLYGRVSDFRAQGKDAYVKLAVGVADIANAAVLFERTFERGEGKAIGPPSQGGDRPEHGGVRLRVFGWVLFALLLPICSASFWINLLDRESSAVNAACVAALTLVDVLLAWALMGFGLGSVLSGLILLVGAALAAAYNLFILNVLERNRVNAKFQV